jgi:hypothetical protein
MNRFVCILALTAALAGPAMANECQDDIAKIDAALASDSKLTPEQRQELDDLRNQAVQLCGAGNEQEGLDVTAQAKAILDLQ